MKLRPTQQHHARISYTKRHTHAIINVDSRSRAAYAALCQARFPLRRFSEINQFFLWGGIACTKFYPNRYTNTRHSCTIPYVPSSEVWVSMQRFTWKSQPLPAHGVNPLIPNFTRIGPEMCNVQVEIYLRP